MYRKGRKIKAVPQQLPFGRSALKKLLQVHLAEQEGWGGGAGLRRVERAAKEWTVTLYWGVEQVCFPSLRPLTCSPILYSSDPPNPNMIPLIGHP